MESAPPLNLSTTVKVEDLQAMVPEEAAQEYTVEGEVVSEAGTTVDEEANTLGTDGDEGNVQKIQNDLDIVQEDTKENLTSDVSLFESKIHPNAKEKDYKCSECQAEFVRASQLRAHERSHYEEQVGSGFSLSFFICLFLDFSILMWVSHLMAVWQSSWRYSPFLSGLSSGPNIMYDLLSAYCTLPPPLHSSPKHSRPFCPHG